MINRNIVINKICKLNQKTIGSNSQLEYINYLDTGNITRNKIDAIKKLTNGIDKYPSRAQRIVQKNTIIYSTVRPEQEHFGIIENEINNLIVSTGFTTLDVIDKYVDSKYLYYKLTNKSVTDYLNVIATNNVTSYPSLNPSDIGNLEFKIPNCISKQQKIAKVLSDLDAKIEINNKINSELEGMAKTLYDYWFVQFDFPDADGKPYKTSGGKMVWNEELKREIPEGWEVKTLLDIATFTNGLACQKFRPNENEDFYRVIKIREMGSGFTDNSEFVSTNIPEKIVVNNGDILFSWSATLDVKIWTGGKGALNQHIFKVTSKKYAKSYYYYELLNYLQHFKMQAELRKTTMGHITQDHLKQSRITIPPTDLINKLDKIITPILVKKVKLDEENQQLASLRDWLLPMLMNGQVRVGDVEEELGMVAEPKVEYKNN